MTLKTLMFGFAAVGVGGAALTGGGLGGGPDAERMVARPPSEVYAAISSMTPEGVQERAVEPGGGPPMTFEVTKERGKAVHYLLRIEGRVAGSVDLAVAPDKDGAATRLTADIDLDQVAFKKLLDSAGPNDFVMMPDSLLNMAASHFLGEMAEKIEAGRPLEPFRPEDLAGWRSRGRGDGEGAGWDMQSAAASPTPIQPTGSTEPMVDPNEAAANYLKGGQ